MMEGFVDEMLITTLKFFIKKIRRGDCTMEQTRAILEAIDSNCEIYGTADEIADFYHVPKQAVYDLMKRKYVGKPKRNIAMYSFSKIRDKVPKSWNEKRKEPKS